MNVAYARPAPTRLEFRHVTMVDVYLFGMTVLSSIHKLVGAFPEPDGYAEIAESHLVPGGETMNAAIVLSNLGLSTKIDGPKFGAETESVLRTYAERYSIDVSAVTTDLEYPGLTDLVLVDDRHRTVFGQFARYFASSVQRWNQPDAAAIADAAIVSIDPFFGASSERAALLACHARTPYVTIDCAFDSELHRRAAATVVSREFRRQHYPDLDDDALLARYREGPGLTIFTAGTREIRHGRPGRSERRAQPIVVDTASTLGAGDVFRAGVVYGLYRAFDDDQVVAFASALSAVACQRLPIADFPPTLAEVEALLAAHRSRRA